MQNGRYGSLGKTVVGFAYISFGTSGTGAGSGEYRIALPVTPKTATNNVIIGSGYLYDASANVIEQVVLAIPSGQTFAVMFKNGTFAITDATPWAWSTSDHLSLSFTYEAA